MYFAPFIIEKHFLCWNISFQKRELRYLPINRSSLLKNRTKYSKSQQSTETEVGHFLYFDCKEDFYELNVINLQLMHVKSGQKYGLITALQNEREIIQYLG